MCMLCSPLDILEQLLWQVRRHPMQTSGLGEYLTTFPHCRHRFFGSLVPESLGAPISCPTIVGTVDGRGGVQERGGTQSLQVQFPGVCDTRLRPLHFSCLCEVAMHEPHSRCGWLVLSVLPQGLQNSPGPGFASTSPALINSIRTTRAGRCPDHRKTPVSVGGGVPIGPWARDCKAEVRILFTISMRWTWNAAGRQNRSSTEYTCFAIMGPRPYRAHRKRMGGRRSRSSGSFRRRASGNGWWYNLPDSQSLHEDRNDVPGHKPRENQRCL